MEFYTIGINLLLVGKNVLTSIDPILINKDMFEKKKAMFEPSYNDLKFTF